MTSVDEIRERFVTSQVVLSLNSSDTIGLSFLENVIFPRAKRLICSLYLLFVLENEPLGL